MSIDYNILSKQKNICEAFRLGLISTESVYLLQIREQKAPTVVLDGGEAALVGGVVH